VKNETNETEIVETIHDVETVHDQEEQEPIYPTDLATLRKSGLAARVSPCDSTVEAAYYELSCYYALLEEPTAQLRAKFTDAECGYMVDVGNGNPFHDLMGKIYFPFSLEDALPDYAAKWEIDGQALMAKVKDLDRLSLMALADAVVGGGYRLYGLVPSHQSLEDVFLSLVDLASDR